MMTFVNMYSPGLRILATHRLVSGLPAVGFAEAFRRAAAVGFMIDEIDSLERLNAAWAKCGDRTMIGAAIGHRLFRLEDRTARGELDVRILHERLLGRALGIGEEAVRHERNLRYMRGIDAAVAEARQGTAQIAFLLKPVSVKQVAESRLAGP